MLLIQLSGTHIVQPCCKVRCWSYNQCVVQQNRTVTIDWSIDHHPCLKPWLHSHIKPDRGLKHSESPNL
ncbi:hypothetical protein DUNSADRAFT_9113 [Dunaliella salina]|uniref:Uncharacterized protein n=1 Tax=Dunaliella salina TaxID=3046 RepID=A0ABQ7GI49_DUNSA|nr:hypothetical protein DUNSADRAFT_9113 [Dunaliella salina]|eukprot:KAF5834290.1 hypothetical protein DUNSADRAFT_9113 [Dunaliella salina]